MAKTAHECSRPPLPTFGDREETWQCPECGRWWGATPWHLIEPPRPAGEGPWFQIVGWPDLEGPYRLRFWYDVVAGRPEVVGAELWGRAPVQQPWPLVELAPMPVTPLKSERLRPRKLLEGVVAHNRAAAHAALEMWSTVAGQAEAVSSFTERRGLDEASASTGRSGLSPADRRKVVRLIRECLINGRPYAAEVAERFGIAESTARSYKRRYMNDPKNWRTDG